MRLEGCAHEEPSGAALRSWCRIRAVGFLRKPSRQPPSVQGQAVPLASLCFVIFEALTHNRGCVCMCPPSLIMQTDGA